MKIYDYLQQTITPSVTHGASLQVFTNAKGRSRTDTPGRYEFCIQTETKQLCGLKLGVGGS